MFLKYSTARKIIRAEEEGGWGDLFTLFIRILCLFHVIHAKFHSKFMCFDRNQARVLFACKGITAAAATIELGFLSFHCWES